MSCLYYIRTRGRFARKIVRFWWAVRQREVEARIWDGMLILLGAIFNSWIGLNWCRVFGDFGQESDGKCLCTVLERSAAETWHHVFGDSVVLSLKQQWRKHSDAEINRLTPKRADNRWKHYKHFIHCKNDWKQVSQSIRSTKCIVEIRGLTELFKGWNLGEHLVKSESRAKRDSPRFKGLELRMRWDVVSMFFFQFFLYFFIFCSYFIFIYIIIHIYSGLAFVHYDYFL